MDGQQRMTRELWARHLADEGITSEEEAKLRETLLSEKATRNELLADDTIHRCLQALSIPLNAEDNFVTGVMQRIVESQRSSQRARSPQPPPIVEESARAAAVDQLTSAVPVIRCEPRRRHNQGWMRPRPVQPFVAVATLALFFSMGSLVGIVFSSRSQVVDRMPPEPNRDDPNHAVTPRTLPIAPASGVGTLVSTEFASWDRPRAEGSRLRPGQFRLERGEAEIELDSGAVVRLVGPAEFNLDSSRELAIHRGTLAAVVPKAAGEVRLRTPTSDVTGEFATVELVVDQNGASDVLVHDGEVTVEPWANAANEKPLRLTSTDLNRATVWQVSDTDPRSPLAMTCQSAGGKFSGRISVNGREIDFDSPEAFEAVRQRVETQFRDSVDQLERDWASAVGAFGGGKAAGEVSLNGVRMGFENLDDVLELQRNLAEAAARQAPPNNAANAGAFQGMININGEVREFSTLEEFKKAQQEAFGPLKTLDLGEWEGGNLRDLFKLAPDLKQPDLKQPDLKQPDLKQPDLKQPDLKQPDLKQPDLKQPGDNPFLPRNVQPANDPPAKNKLNWKGV